MKCQIKMLSAAALCALIIAPVIAVAQPPAKPQRPAKATPPALIKPEVVATPLRTSNLLAVPPTKPKVVTALAPWHPVTGTPRSIIFVGGKPQGGSNVELNPQPIPPGHVAPGDPQH
jgi:hypothetical protein